ncbi:MAG: peptidase T [Elusimicrobiales bacterium]
MRNELYRRFERYVKIDTKSDEASKTCPSTPGQLKLARLAAQEMKEIGLKKVSVDKNGYVLGELPANTAKKVPAIGFIAHLDTAPDASGANVKPQIHRNYKGGPIKIAPGVMLTTADSPELKKCIGEDIVTASGKTLLGADNKAGMAIILAAANFLKNNPQIKHGALKIAFTPDEEIGRGANRFPLKKFGAHCAYTVDGDTAGVIEDETFNADGIAITVTGKSVHPGSAKNVMANAVRIAADIAASWPENMLPETTEKREGFIMFTACAAGIESAALKGIAREHDLKKLRALEKMLEAIIAEKRVKYPAARIELKFTQQYRNMKSELDKHPQVMEHALAAMKEEGIVPRIKPVRGGTDGARLSFMGLPTPNIFTGGACFHGDREWVSLHGMEKSARAVIAILRQWEQASR